ncbi:glycoside hydrolase family 43 protein [Treponema pectinovorum]|uniref:glycoside hydrolase family 43 protein n=1 Tax=Treponema pectinovorum TaxID=164 RepID=UPI0011CAA93E|nr:glycoside hydrolase 43 family protein [Treponema pectinovorum]
MYKNPIILCDYSDPDVIRVGEDFFLVASSFNFTPGLPILTSKNLVDWKLVNYAVDNIPIARYKYPQNAEGIWAPAFSYHDGMYYITVGLPDEGIYITQTEDILGKWSPLKEIFHAKGFIDPCLFWDDDGKAYVVHAYARSRCGFNSKIGILDFDDKNLVCVGEDRFIFDGTKTQPTIEGPKVYKRNGYYYIFAPAGGVTDGWQTVLRSKNIEGPYEEKIVLEQGSTEINGPHQGALVTTALGEDWFIHFQERGIYGRVANLEPVSWKDGWPLMGTSVKTGVWPGEPVEKYLYPKVKKSKLFDSNITIKNVRAFEGASLEWQWNGNHDDSFASQVGPQNKAAESFRLNVLNVSSHSQNGFPVLWNSSNVLTQKIKYESFYFTANAVLKELPQKCRAGIIFSGEEYASVAVERTFNGFDLVYIESQNKELTDEVRTEKVKMRIPIKLSKANQTVKFRMDFIPFSIYAGAVQFSVESGVFFKTFKWKSEYFGTENAHWVGGRFGLYAVGDVFGNVLFYDVKVRH